MPSILRNLVFQYILNFEYASVFYTINSYVNYTGISHKLPLIFYIAFNYGLSNKSKCLAIQDYSFVEQTGLPLASSRIQ